MFIGICKTSVPKLTFYIFITSQIHGRDLNNEIHMQLRCPKPLCFVLKVPETGERRTERQSHANFAGHFPGNKFGSLKASKTHRYTCKLALQKSKLFVLGFPAAWPYCFIQTLQMFHMLEVYCTNTWRGKHSTCESQNLQISCIATSMPQSCHCNSLGTGSLFH